MADQPTTSTQPLPTPPENYTPPPHLHPSRELHAIVSTHSGTHQAATILNEQVIPLLSSHLGVDRVDPKKGLLVHTTTSARSIIELTTSLLLFNARKGVKTTIILLSGDGGIVDIVNTLTTQLQREIDDYRPPSIFFKPTLVLWPCGTANALTHSLGVAGDPGRSLLYGRARPLAQFEVRVGRGARFVTEEGRGREGVERDGYVDPQGDVRVYGCVVFSWGLHASLVSLSDTVEYRRHGLDRFKMAAGELMGEDHVYQGKVKVRREVGGEWVELGESWRYVLAGLVSNLEEKFVISPESKGGDGVLRLVSIGDVPVQEVGRLLGLAYEGGKHVMEETVGYEPVEGLRIEFEESEEKYRFVCIDGKIVAVEPGGWVEVRNLPGTGVEGRRVVEVVV